MDSSSGTDGEHDPIACSASTSSVEEVRPPLSENPNHPVSQQNHQHQNRKHESAVTGDENLVVLERAYRTPGRHRKLTNKVEHCVYATTPRRARKGRSPYSKCGATAASDTESFTGNRGKIADNGYANSRLNSQTSARALVGLFSSAHVSHSRSNSLDSSLYDKQGPEHFDLEQDNSFWKDHNVQVLIRLRPLNTHESAASGMYMCLKQTSPKSLTWTGHPETRFTFDHVASPSITQESLFQVVGLPMVDNCIQGYNSSIFAYGQTGSGKTYTMLGDIFEKENELNPNRGIIPRIFEYLFSKAEMEEKAREQEHFTITCRCSFLEIYNEQITDLLDPASTNLQIHEDPRKGVFVENLTEIKVKKATDVLGLLLQGTANRRVAQTRMNKESSRSHCVFTCTIESSWIKESFTNSRFGRLNLVDLAGSERQKASGAEGERLREAVNINRSLSALGLVIMNLVDVAQGKQRHVPYRDSKLTFLLQDSLGGNSKTAIIATISPSISCANETLSTLKFAQRAKFIQNNAIINQDASANITALHIQIQDLKEEIEQLKKQTVNSMKPDEPTFNTTDGSLINEDSHGLVKGESSQTHDFSIKTKKPLEIDILHNTTLKDNDSFVAENKQLDMMLQGYLREINYLKTILSVKEEKVKRLESVLNNVMSVEECQDKEKIALQHEVDALRERMNENPDVIRLATENMCLNEQLRRYQEFYGREREMLLMEVCRLRGQVSNALQVGEVQEEQKIHVENRLDEISSSQDMQSNNMEEGNPDHTKFITVLEEGNRVLDEALQEIQQIDASREATGHNKFQSLLHQLHRMTKDVEAKIRHFCRIHNDSMMGSEYPEKGNDEDSFQESNEDSSSTKSSNLVSEQEFESKIDLTVSEVESGNLSSFENDYQRKFHKKFDRPNLVLSDMRGKDRFFSNSIWNTLATINEIFNCQDGTSEFSLHGWKIGFEENPYQTCTKALNYEKIVEQVHNKISDLSFMLLDEEQRTYKVVNKLRKQGQQWSSERLNLRRQVMKLESLESGKNKEIAALKNEEEALASIVDKMLREEQTIREQLINCREQLIYTEKQSTVWEQLYKQLIIERDNKAYNTVHDLNYEEDKTVVAAKYEDQVLKEELNNTQLAVQLVKKQVSLIESEMKNMMVALDERIKDAQVSWEGEKMDIIMELNKVKDETSDKVSQAAAAIMKLPEEQSIREILEESVEMDKSNQIKVSQDFNKEKNFSSSHFKTFDRSINTLLDKLERIESKLKHAQEFESIFFNSLDGTNSQLYQLQEDTISFAASICDKLLETVAEKEHLHEELGRQEDLLRGSFFDLRLLQEAAAESMNMKAEMERTILVIKSLQQELDSKVTQLKKMEDEKSSLQQEKQKDEETIALLTKSLTQAEETVGSMKALNAELEQNLEEATSSITSLQQNLEEKKLELAHLKLEHLNSERLINKNIMTSDKDQFCKQIIELSGQLESLRLSEDAHRKLAEESKEISDALKCQLHDKETEVKLLEKSILELEATISALETQMEIMRRESERNQIIKEDLEMELQACRHQLLTMDTEQESTDIFDEYDDHTLADGVYVTPKRKQRVDKNSEIYHEELQTCRQRICELENMAMLREAEIAELKRRLAEAERMTYDVIKDLIGVKSNITESVLNLDCNRVSKEFKELEALRHQYKEEKARWSEDISRRQTEAVAAQVALEKTRHKAFLLKAENRRLKADILKGKKKSMQSNGEDDHNNNNNNAA
uniref:Kinesin 12-Id protein n=1 Tax=Marsilea vestita TaxID=59764 RepID=A0A142KWB8_MARVE|nr:kinesin 12-Id protein [Marsilea vestita]